MISYTIKQFIRGTRAKLSCPDCGGSCHCPFPSDYIGNVTVSCCYCSWSVLAAVTRRRIDEAATDVSRGPIIGSAVKASRMNIDPWNKNIGPCAAPGCNRRAERASGLCKLHHYRWEAAHRPDMALWLDHGGLTAKTFRGLVNKGYINEDPW